MSARGNGMMAVIGKPGPGNLNDALDKIMLSSDPASPVPERPAEVEAAAPIPEAPIEKPAVAPRVKAGKGSALSGGILGELTAQQKRPRVKVTLNTRIDDFIDEAINKTLRDLAERGYSDITKESIVNLSLVRGLNLTPPEGWELL
ncbi:hypothetical protein [Edaphobacter aggregans]|uniref:hypothetical protein n=1 Tax=Edaphobacter aggregans TaxID=570835 RepID=UPI0012FAAC2D|nr:hypothetical protein [Edaphobacter aggregans]